MPATCTARHCYRCADCLEVVFVDGDVHRQLECGVCGGRFECMGRVGRSGRLEVDHYECACDARCTGARGPQCDCQCGGVNHGTGRVVLVTSDAGAVPRAMPKDAAKANARVAEWREVVAAIEAKLEALPKRTGAYLPREAFMQTVEAQRLRRELRKLSTRRTHHGRMKAAAELLERVPAPVALPEPEPETPKVPVALPFGERVEVEGTIRSVKMHDTAYGSVSRVTIEVEAEGGVWLAWGTLPEVVADEIDRLYREAIDRNAEARAEGRLQDIVDLERGPYRCIAPGKRIKLTARLEAGRDEYFAVFKRPTKASLVA